MDRKCLAIKKDGTKCLNFSLNSFNFCKVHWKQSEKTVEGEKCLICFEAGPLFQLSCLHYVHLECVSQTINPECPACRAPLDNIPKIIKERIVVAGDKFKIEKDQETLMEFLNSQDTDCSSIVSAEIPCTLFYLHSLKIPNYFLPKKISIEIEENQPPPPLGFFAFAIIKSVYELIEEKINSSDTDEESEIDIDDEEDSHQERHIICVEVTML
jgi:hypothetical protein